MEKIILRRKIDVSENRNLIQSFANRSGKPFKEVEKLWDKATKLVIQKGIPKTSDIFLGLVSSTLQKALKV